MSVVKAFYSGRKLLVQHAVLAAKFFMRRDHKKRLPIHLPPHLKVEFFTNSRFVGILYYFGLK